MTQGNDPRAARESARRWQLLAERRRRHLIELYRSGRWQRYYTEDQLTARMREAGRNIDGWATLSGEAPLDADDVTPRREAAE